LNKKKRNPIKLSYEESHKEIDGVLYKKCNHHFENFPDEDLWFPQTEEYFYKNKLNKTDGFNPECKLCSIARSSKRQNENREDYLDYMKNYYQETHDQQIEGFHQHRLDSLEEHNAYYADYQKKNPEYFIKYGKDQRQNHLHIISEKEWLNCKRYFENTCAYCGLPIDQHWHMRKEKLILFDFCKDHADYNGLRDLSNCVPACKSCNSHKWQSSIEEWYIESNPVFDKNKLDKIKMWLDNDYKKYIVNIDIEPPIPRERAKGQTREGKWYNLKDPSNKASRKKRVIFT